MREREGGPQNRGRREERVREKRKWTRKRAKWEKEMRKNGGFRTDETV